MIDRMSETITVTEIGHTTFGLFMLFSSWWMDYLNPLLQMFMAVGGVVLLYYSIRHMRQSWINKKLLNEKEKLELHKLEKQQ